MLWILLPVMLVGGLAGYSDLQSERLEKRFPPLGEFALVENTRMHFTESGPKDAQGPPIVLIHGASTSLRDFHASLVEPLSRTHRVITVDRPGHGYSDRPDGTWPSPAEQARLIHQLLLDLGVETPILVGHSWSGSVVLAYLLTFPDEAAAGVMLAGGSHPWTGGVAWYNNLAGVPMLGPLFAHTLPLTLGRLSIDGGIAETFAPNPVPAAYRQRTGVELTLRPGTFLANAEDIRRLSPFLEQQSEHYGYIRHPLLLISGDADRIVPAWNHAERLARQAPNVELVYLDGVGHGLHHVRTAQIVGLIEDFGRRVVR
jgi:pimeloyl-ACP methyl ester carboxylesterase